MAVSPDRTILFSLFMFTVDMRPDDPAYTPTLIGHLKALTEMGYHGFDLPIPARDTLDHAPEIESYRRLKQAFDAAGLKDAVFTTNVGATKRFDPTSPDPEQRGQALDYLKSRVDITAILGGKKDSVLAGPIVLPYGLYPSLDPDTPLWSDALQDWLVDRYETARPVIAELAGYAGSKGVKLAIEPVDHWETAAPNMVSEVLDFLVGIDSSEVGVAVDVAHVMLGSSGPEAYAKDIAATIAQKRLHYVHISSLDRGSFGDVWIAWDQFLNPIIPHFNGPYLVEVFNAIPVFHGPLRQTRRKFWIPGEDEPVAGRPSAYDVAREGLDVVKKQFARLAVA
ncbi:sugar phosphate isomerase/epimerase family protein [Rhizobium sp.]